MAKALTKDRFAHLLQTIAEIGIALSAEKDQQQLLENILIKALEITNADAGTLYSCVDDNALQFEILINRSMNLRFGGSSGKKSNFENLPLYDDKGKPNNKMIATWAANNRKTIIIKNAYTNKKFDLSGTKAFDKKTGYHSKTFLVVPMTNHLNELVGVLQLINPLDHSSFTPLEKLLVEALASQAAISISNMRLRQAQKDLFDSLIQLIAKAIDEKSPYTGGHCRRVPVLTKMLAESTCAIQSGPLKEFTMTEDELYELEVAAWLHDCGKITTPEAVVDKGTKLEEIKDGIHLIDARFEVIKREAVIKALQQQLQKNAKPYNIHSDQGLQNELTQIDRERDLIRFCNIGGETIKTEHVDAIKQVAKRRWLNPEGVVEPFLTEQEVQFLSINRGTLSDSERKIINNHVSVTIKMLQSLPYPKNLKNVPDLAGSHHEKLDGSGYPRGLTKAELSIPARMIAIADIFEALTAKDRPYKKSMALKEALTILGEMKLKGHIDPDLFDIFIHDKIYLKYAEEFLNGAVLDFDVTNIPGYQSL